MTDKEFFKRAKKAHERMKKDPKAMQEEKERRELLEKSLMDGLEKYL